MRWLKEESGATAVFFTVILVPVVAIVAFVVDIGLMQWEVRQLQNGADAAALAIAQDCADDLPCDEPSGRVSAEGLADLNANDGAANVEEVVFDLYGPNTVTVRLSTLDEGRLPRLSYIFAPILGFDFGNFEREATALWGPMALDRSIPLTISECEWRLATGSGPANADNEFVPPPSLPSASTVILIKANPNVNTCTIENSPGFYQPGGFGWLDSTADGCEAFVFLFGVPGNTGSGPPSPDCNANQYDYPSLLGSTVLIPIHRNTNDLGGNNLEYDMIAYAAFEITSYKLSGSIEGGPETCPGTGSNQRCLIGRFVDRVPIGGRVDVDLPDLGVRTVQLIG